MELTDEQKERFEAAIKKRTDVEGDIEGRALNDLGLSFAELQDALVESGIFVRVDDVEQAIDDASSEEQADERPAGPQHTDIRGFY